MDLMQKTSEYLEKIYAGILGKVIGVRLGAPVENPIWDYERIQQVYGEINYYIKDYKHFAADDDINGPLFFIRAIEDFYKETKGLTARDIGKTWLNYTARGRGMFWWGGYGVSTEHTAFENLKAGIEAPNSGSIIKNGKVLAEQIGGQIFVDTWGLVFPGNPEKAAEYAAMAASVSHDGEGLNGARFVAAAVSLAFVKKNVEEIFLGAINFLEEGSEYRKMAYDVYNHYKEAPDDWRKTFRYVEKVYGDKEKYPGIVHIIPNGAVVVLSLLHGKGDFSRSISIATMCGWDTDCNAGNVGTVLGVLNGPDGIEKKWKDPINDAVVCSSVIGSLNIVDLPSIAKYIFWLSGIINNSNVEGNSNGKNNFFDFELPGSSHGFKTNMEDSIKLSNVQEKLENNRCLKIAVNKLEKLAYFDIFRKFFYRRRDFNDERYRPMFSPLLYSGQEIGCKVMAEHIPEDGEIIARMFAKCTDGKELLAEKKVRLQKNKWSLLVFRLPDSLGSAIETAGARFYNVSSKPFHGALYLDDFFVRGKARYTIDFSRQNEEFGSVTQFTFNEGSWRLDNGMLHGICADEGALFTGDIKWQNYTLKTTVKPLFGKEFALIFRAQGNLKHYALYFNGKEVALVKNFYKERELKKVTFTIENDKWYEITVKVVHGRITAYVGKQKVLEYEDECFIPNGYVGYSIRKGTHIVIKDYFFEEV